MPPWGDPPATQWLRQQNQNIRRVSEEEPPEEDLPANVRRFMPRNPARPPKPEEEVKDPMAPAQNLGAGLPPDWLAKAAGRAMTPEERNVFMRGSNVRSLAVERAIRDPENVKRRQDNLVDSAIKRQKLQRRMDEIARGVGSQPPARPPYARPERAEPGQLAEFGRNQYMLAPGDNSWWILHSATDSNGWSPISNFDNEAGAQRHLQTLLNPGPQRQ